MNCGFFHEEVMDRRLREVGENCGATVSREYPVKIGGSVSYVDLMIEKKGAITVCEAEQSRHRVGNDYRKALALGARLLLIATPDSITAQACRRELRRHLSKGASLRVIVCPLGSAIQILGETLGCAMSNTISSTPKTRT